MYVDLIIRTVDLATFFEVHFQKTGEKMRRRKKVRSEIVSLHFFGSLVQFFTLLSEEETETSFPPHSNLDFLANQEVNVANK